MRSGSKINTYLVVLHMHTLTHPICASLFFFSSLSFFLSLLTCCCLVSSSFLPNVQFDKEIDLLLIYYIELIYLIHLPLCDFL